MKKRLYTQRITPNLLLNEIFQADPSLRGQLQPDGSFLDPRVKISSRGNTTIISAESDAILDQVEVILAGHDPDASDPADVLEQERAAAADVIRASTSPLGMALAKYLGLS